LRIISGTYKGRQIHPPKSIQARPTTDFAKENLFNILETRLDFEGKNVLDLFAGTGNMSYEFISRGCAYVTAVEMNFKHIKFIKKTLALLEMQNIEVKRKDVFKYLESPDQSFHVIFADPPYQMKEMGDLPDRIFSTTILQKDGYFILEHSKHTDFSGHPNLHEKRAYGSVHFSIFRHN